MMMARRYLLDKPRPWAPCFHWPESDLANFEPIE